MSFLNIIPERDEEPTRSERSFVIPRRTEEVLEAEGEAEYMRMLAEAYDTPDKKEFYEFTLALDALKQSLDGGEKTIILGENSPLAQILLNP